MRINPHNFNITEPTEGHVEMPAVGGIAPFISEQWWDKLTSAIRTQYDLQKWYQMARLARHIYLIDPRRIPDFVVTEEIKSYLLSELENLPGNSPISLYLDYVQILFSLFGIAPQSIGVINQMDQTITPYVINRYSAQPLNNLHPLADLRLLFPQDALTSRTEVSAKLNQTMIYLNTISAGADRYSPDQLNQLADFRILWPNEFEELRLPPEINNPKFMSEFYQTQLQWRDMDLSVIASIQIITAPYCIVGKDGRLYLTSLPPEDGKLLPPSLLI